MTPSALLAEAPERIVVFRALVLGDMLCATPALRALRAGFPHAAITLAGLPWARDWAGRLDSIDAFLAFPGHPALPEGGHDVRELPDWLAQVQRHRFDLAVQLHGDGRVTNPLVATFGARRMAGFAAAGAWRPADDGALFTPWPEHGHEIDRLLALTDHLGLARQGVSLDFPLNDADRQAARALLAARAPSHGPYVCVHAGAQLPSRRWGAPRFAAVADALAAQGHTIVLTGTPHEAPLVTALAAAMRRPSVDLCGATSLWTLGALVEEAAAVVCNDTGLSHVAAALRRPSVVVSCGADASRWAPLDAQRHRVLAAPVPCRPCMHTHCPTAHECAAAITPAQVLDALRCVMAEADAAWRPPRPSGTRVAAAGL